MPGEVMQVDVGDHTFDVRAEGPADGDPILLLHGFPETSLSWTAVMPLLADRGAARATPPTSSATPPARARTSSEAYSAPNLAQVTADLMTALDIDRPTWSATTGAPTWRGRWPAGTPTGCAR